MPKETALAINPVNLNTILPRIKQWESVHNRKISPDIIEALMRGELDAAAGRRLEAQRVAQEDRRLGIAEDRATAEERAARVSGAAGLGTTALTTYLLYKGGMFGGGGSGAATSVGGTEAALSTSATPGVTPAVTSGTPEILSVPGAGTAAVSAGVGYGAGRLVSRPFKENRGVRTRAGVLSGVGTGAATGAALGAPAGGVGAVPGAILGGIMGGVSGYAGANK